MGHVSIVKYVVMHDHVHDLVLNNRHVTNDGNPLYRWSHDPYYALNMGTYNVQYQE